jgi:hypothetical protein
LGIGGVQSKIVSVSKYIERKAPDIRIHVVLRDKPNFRLDGKLKKTHIIIHYKPSWSLGFVHIPFSLFFLWKTIILQPQVILTYYDVLSSLAVIFSRLLFWQRIRVVLNEDTCRHACFSRQTLVCTLYPRRQIIVPTRVAKAIWSNAEFGTTCVIRIGPR